MSQPVSSISVLAVTAIASAEISAKRFVGFDGAQTGDGGVVWGISGSDAKVGDAVKLDVIGQFDMIAAAAIPRGSEIQSDANGQPIVKAAGAGVGHAVTEAANPGDIVTVLIK